MLKYKVVIFDLFGTLVNSFPRPEYGTVLLEMSSLLSIPNEEFLRLWVGTSEQRFTGIFPSIEANLKYICRELKFQVADALIEEAARIRFMFAVRSMKVKPSGTKVVSSLRTKGFRLALISNSAPEAPIIWKDLPFARLFDVTVFSCQVGLQKPDPRIFRLALEQLAVKPEECLYIGDNVDTDILGAASIGMHSVLISAPDTDATNWNGLTITSLEKLLELVK
jgi:putative hydrolase of the HAD superfamily